MRIVLMACLAFALASAAYAHSWYDPDCCSGFDCSPVEKVEMVAGARFYGAQSLAPALPVMVVTTKHGTVAVPHGFKTRQSKDGAMHACIVGGNLICLYLPPSL